MKWILIATGALVLLVAGALVALPWLVDVPRVQAYVAQAASQALGRPVRFASLSVSALPTPGVRLSGLQVGEDPRFGTQPFLMVDEGRFRLRLRPLLSGRVELTDLTLEGVRVEIIDDAGRLNVASLGADRPRGDGRRRARRRRRPGRGCRRHPQPGPDQGQCGALRAARCPGARRAPRGPTISVVRPAGDDLRSPRASARLAPGGLRLERPRRR